MPARAHATMKGPNPLTLTKLTIRAYAKAAALKPYRSASK